MALVPWPPTTSAAARTAAANRLSAAVGGRTLAADSTVDMDATNSLGEAAAAMVEDYAPGAPQPLKDEALIRFAGYLAQSDFGTVIKESGLPGHEAEYVTNHANAWRNSGAGMLLTRWRVRRAGTIG